MPAARLTAHAVAKPWGRRNLQPAFESLKTGNEPVGEVRFAAPDDSTLGIKFMFTEERLSVQVHPNDDQARARGFVRGKDEAWFIVDARSDSTIALGPARPISGEELRASACDGSIVDLLDWRRVSAGDLIYVPAGTIHAIGAGLTLIEVHQNLDLTYRLYDYGRARDLHLDEAVSVSDLDPFPASPPPPGPLAAERQFSVEQWTTGMHQHDVQGGTGFFVPLTMQGRIDGQPWLPGQCWAVTGAFCADIDPGASALFAYPCPGSC